jgi:hypothetical protein
MVKTLVSECLTCVKVKNVDFSMVGIFHDQNIGFSMAGMGCGQTFVSAWHVMVKNVGVRLALVKQVDLLKRGEQFCQDC